VRAASAAGARATLTFSGSSVAFVTTRGPDRGKAEIWLDGVKIKTIDLYAASQGTRRIVYVRNNLAVGEHTLQIRVVGAKSGASSGTRVDIDAFVVLR
jgi:hypothetical protein